MDLRPFLTSEDEDERPQLLCRTDGRALIYTAKINAINAEPEAGKTTVALYACSQEMLAGNFVGYIDFEDGPSGIVAKLRHLGVPDELIDGRFFYIRPSEPLGPAARAVLDDVLSIRPSLVVVDGVTEALTLERLSLKDNAEVAVFYERLLRPIARAGAAVLLLDHVTKAREDRGRWAIGAQHKLAAIDGAAFALTVVDPFGRGSNGRLRLDVVKDRPGYVRGFAAGGRVAEILVRCEAEGAIALDILPVDTEERESFRPTRLMERISLCLEETPEPLSQRAVCDAVVGKVSYLRKALEVLVREGFVERIEIGRSMLHRSVKPFREQPSETDS